MHHVFSRCGGHNAKPTTSKCRAKRPESAYRGVAATSATTRGVRAGVLRIAPGLLLAPLPERAHKSEDTASSNVFFIGFPGALRERSRASLATANPRRALAPRRGNVNHTLASTSNGETARTVTGQDPSSWAARRARPSRRSAAAKSSASRRLAIAIAMKATCPRPDCRNLSPLDK
jgi:hypothetical protein